MLTVRLTGCTECNSIPILLSDIDCKIGSVAKNLYNNTIFALNIPIDTSVMSDLLHYKRILTYKFCNHHYAHHYKVDKIASRVKLLKFK